MGNGIDSKLANAVLIALQAVAEDYEADVVERLAIAARFWWKCPACRLVLLWGETCTCEDEDKE